MLPERKLEPCLRIPQVTVVRPLETRESGDYSI